MGIVFEENMECVLSDGTVLRSDIYRPDDNQKYPVLMLRLPYNKKTPRYYDEYLEVPRMVKAGYIVILQDVRGRFASDGNFYPFVYEGKDGYQAVEWAAQLPFSNGKVGLFGMSYHGYTQLAAAVEKPPSLRAIAPVMTMSDPWNDLLHGESASSIGNFMTWTLGSIVEDQLERKGNAQKEKVNQYIDNLEQWLHAAPADEWPPMKELDPNSFYFDVLKGDLPDGFKERVQLLRKLEKVEIPALFMGGWFDALLQPTLKAYSAYGGEKMLWIGPWTHEEMSGRAGAVFFENGEQKIGVNQIADPTELHIKWFDKWLKNRPFNIEKPVHIYMLGQKKWESFENWPFTSGLSKVLYLHSKGASQSRNGDGELLLVPMKESAAPSKILLDPKNPVPVRGGGVLIAGHESGVFEIGDIQDRNDISVFTSEKLDNDTEILGTVYSKIWAASESPYLDIFIRVSDVCPDGSVYNILDTFHRESVKKEGEPICLELEVGHTAYLLKADHQLRVEIAASQSPLYDINLNNGQTTKTASHGIEAHQYVFHEKNYPSFISLPIR